jgi:hypothetical protein
MSSGHLFAAFLSLSSGNLRIPLLETSFVNCFTLFVELSFVMV